MRYFLDTDSLSYYFRGEGQIARRLAALTPMDIGIPAPVLYESRHGILRLASGARQAALLAALDRAIQVMDVVSFDQNAAEAAARIRTGLEKSGAMIGPMDVQIAGIVVAQSGVLVTRNVREFSRIAGLSIENWYNSVPSEL